MIYTCQETKWVELTSWQTDWWTDWLTDWLAVSPQHLSELMRLIIHSLLFTGSTQPKLLQSKESMLSPNLEPLPSHPRIYEHTYTPAPSVVQSVCEACSTLLQTSCGYWSDLANPRGRGSNSNRHGRWPTTARFTASPHPAALSWGQELLPRLQ